MALGEDGAQTEVVAAAGYDGRSHRAPCNALRNALRAAIGAAMRSVSTPEEVGLAGLAASRFRYGR